MGKQARKQGKGRPRGGRPAATRRGVCRKCGCSQFDPCVTPEGDCCSWTDRTQTLCSTCAGGRRHECARPYRNPVRATHA